MSDEHRARRESLGEDREELKDRLHQCLFETIEICIDAEQAAFSIADLAATDLMPDERLQTLENLYKNIIRSHDTQKAAQDIAFLLAERTREEKVEELLETGVEEYINRNLRV